LTGDGGLLSLGHVEPGKGKNMNRIEIRDAKMKVLLDRMDLLEAEVTNIQDMYYDAANIECRELIEEQQLIRDTMYNRVRKPEEKKDETRNDKV
jgi:hypothetical protein